MKKLNALLLASTCVAGIYAMPAFAQDAGDQASVAAPQAEAPEADSGEVVVTGSRITRPNAAAASPITSVTSESIRAQAAVNIEEVLNRIPSIAPDSQQNYQDSDGRQRIKLRNLGFERTLTLIDGKRAGTMNGVDANMIPTSLIKRVDVLTGGASAVYGSDAIAGVVNFIMDDSFEGIQVNANYNFYAHQNKPGLVSQVASQYGFAQPTHDFATDGGRVDLSLTAGKKLFDDRFHISAYVNYRKAELVPFSARESAGCELTEAGKDGPLGCTTSTYTPYGYVSPRGGPANGSVFVNNPNGTRSLLPYSAAYAANPFDGLSFQRENERWNAGGFTKFEISDAAEVYANVMWFRDESSNPFPARVISSTAYGDGSQAYTVRCNNPFMSAAQAQTLCGTNAGTSATLPIELRYRATGVDPISDRYLNQGLRISGGVRGEFAKGWNYDLGGVYARNKLAMTWGQPDFNRVNNALDTVNNNGTITCRNTADGCVAFDPFSANSATNNQALFDYLMVGGYGTNTTTNTLYNAIATIQGDLGTYGIKSPWAEDGLAIAFGAEYREDKLQSVSDDWWRANVDSGPNRTLGQHVWEGNIELQAPIAQHKPFADLLQVNGASVEVQQQSQHILDLEGRGDLGAESRHHLPRLDQPCAARTDGDRSVPGQQQQLWPHRSGLVQRFLRADHYRLHHWSKRPAGSDLRCSCRLARCVRCDRSCGQSLRQPDPALPDRCRLHLSCGWLHGESGNCLYEDLRRRAEAALPARPDTLGRPVHDRSERLDRVLQLRLFRRRLSPDWQRLLLPHVRAQRRRNAVQPDDHQRNCRLHSSRHDQLLQKQVLWLGFPGSVCAAHG